MLKYFLYSYRVTFLIVIGLALLGIQALFTLPRESTPEIEIPIGVVVTAYPGASAVDIEELVTKPVEDTVATIAGVDEVSSSSSLGVSSVTVEFAANEDVKESLRKLREATDTIPDLPEDAGDPRVIEVSFENEPIISLSLSGIEDRRLLSLYGEELADELESIPDISSVRVVGGVGDEINVEIDPESLVNRGLTVSQIAGSIRAANITAPLGQLETSQFLYNLRLAGGFQSVADVAQIPITLPTGEVIPLREVANVSADVSSQSSISRVSIEGSPTKNAVTLEVRKRTGGNIVAIVDEAKARAEEYRAEQLPPGVEITSFSDRADEIRRSLSDVSRSGLQTFIIVFLILSLFLGWKEASIASFAVPLTFLIAFLVFNVTDITLNGISLFSLILSLGLLVDTAIVIVEGVHVEQVSGSTDLRKSTYGVLKTFAKPLTSGVLTTVAAFFPMLLVSGIIGQFLRTIPVVLSASLLASLVVALLILPAVAVAVFTRFPKVHKETWFDTRFDQFRGRYNGFIERLMASRRQQNILIATLVILLFLGLSLPFTGILKTALFPEVDIDFILGNVELAANTRLEQTDQAVRQVEDILRSVPEVSSFAVNAGSGTSADIGGGASATHLGSFFINLHKDRDRSSLEISDELREKLVGIAGAEVSIIEVSAGPPSSAPIEFRLASDNLEDLNTASLKIADRLREIPGVVEIDRSTDSSTSEFVLQIRRDELARYGLTAPEVANLLRQVVFGDDVTNFLDADSQEIQVRVEGSDFTKNPDAVLNVPLLSRNGQTIHIRDVATLELQPSLASIRRREGKREISVTGDVEGNANANIVSQQIQNEFDSLGIPRSVELRVGGEQQETEETFAELYRSMILAVIAIAGILVIEFNSYRQPLLIILTIPLALIGVLFGLLITGGQLNFAAFIGLVSLAGIVVNNAILLVDQANERLREGGAPEAAAQEAANSRLRPIILTTFTTAAGVAPLIFVDEFFRDMALTIITGLLFSTILTLVLIPILYTRQQHNEERRARRRALKAEQNHQLV